MAKQPRQDISDDPIDGSDDAPDRLGRIDFARAVVAALDALKAQPSSSVVGLVGPWGSGKTSVISLVKSELSKEKQTSDGPRWAVVDFNPWFFQDLPSLHWGFMRALTDAIAPEAKRSRKARDAISALGVAIAPVGAVGQLVGVNLSESVKTASKLISTRNSPDRQQKNLAKLLKDRKRPVLVILDDLDRLSPDELLIVFKLIRLVGRLPYVHYVIAYDEGTLLAIVSQTGLAGGGNGRAAAYLEKMIQLRLDIPPLRQLQIDSLIEETLERLSHSIGLEMDVHEQGRFTAAYQLHMRRHLSTPRIIKRYAAQLEALFPSIANEVDSADFLICAWLSTVTPRLYALLPREKRTLVGPGSSIADAMSGRSKKPSDFTEHWDGVFSECDVDGDLKDAVTGALASLFPMLNDIMRKSTTFSGGTPRIKSIAHTDYFDRFFALQVPVEDIPDSVVRHAYEAILANSSNAELERVRDAFTSNLRLITAKLEGQLSLSPNQDDARALLLWVAGKYNEVPEGGSLFGARSHVNGLCVRLYLQLTPTVDVLYEVIQKISEMRGGLTLAAWLTGASDGHSFSGNQEDVAARITAYPEVRARFGAIIKTKFQANEATAPLELPDEIWPCFWDWYEIDSTGLREWLTGQYESGRWKRLDTTARLVSARTRWGLSVPEWRISELDLSVVEELVGIDELIQECGSAAGEPDRIAVPLHANFTIENRVNYVLGIVDDLQTGRRARPTSSAKLDGEGGDLV